MSDIETLRGFIIGIFTDKRRREARPKALAALKRMEKELYLLRRMKEANDSKPDFEKLWEEASFIVAENMALRCENNLLKKEIKNLKILLDKG